MISCMISYLFYDIRVAQERLSYDIMYDIIYMKHMVRYI
jgi:hypothetical protein